MMTLASLLVKATLLTALLGTPNRGAMPLTLSNWAWTSARVALAFSGLSRPKLRVRPRPVERSREPATLRRPAMPATPAEARAASSGGSLPANHTCLLASA